MGVGHFGQEKNLGESIQKGNGSTRIVFSFARGSPYMIHVNVYGMNACVCVCIILQNTIKSTFAHVEL